MGLGEKDFAYRSCDQVGRCHLFEIWDAEMSERRKLYNWQSERAATL
jgi:hypothetical protein